MMDMETMRAAVVVAGAVLVVGLAAYSRRLLGVFARRVRKTTSTVFAYWMIVVFGVLFESSGASLGRHLVEPLLTTFGVVVLTLWGVWFLNDIFDKETDKIANPDRALAREDVSESTMALASLVTLVLALALATTVNAYTLAVIGFVVAVNVAYSVPPLRLKRMALPSMVCNGVLVPSGFLLGSSVVVSRPSEFTLLVAGLGTVAMVVNISYWDFKDAEDDQKTDAETFVTKYGREPVRRTLVVAMPVTYLAFVFLLDLSQWLPVFLIFPAVSAYLFFTRTERYHRLAYEIDVLNGIYFLLLGALYFVQ